MENRQPTYPGRVVLTPVPGAENTYVMTRADEPTVEGTPLNKATLLKDATAALYGLGTDAVPDDIFQKISENIFAVGDTLTTMRTDMGDKWRLCNGVAVTREEYSELSSLVPVTLYGDWTSALYGNPFLTSGYKDLYSDIVFINGYYYMAHMSKTNTGNIALSRSSDLKSWTVIGQRAVGGSFSKFHLLYGNGIVAAFCAYSSGAKCFYSTSIETSFSSWASSTISNSSFELSGPLDAKFLNGNFVLLFQNQKSSTAGYSSVVAYSNDSAVWNFINIPSPSYGRSFTPWAVAYGDGKYHVVGWTNDGTASYIYFSSSATLSSFPSFSKSHIKGYSDIGALDYVNGIFILAFRGEYGLEIHRTTNLYASTSYWTSETVSSSSLGYYDNIFISYEDENIIIFTSRSNTASGGSNPNYKIQLFFFKELDDPVNVLNVPTSYNSSDKVVSPIGFINYSSSYKIPYLPMNASDNDFISYGVSEMDKSKIQLPNISSEDGLTYTYIKVKE